MALTFCVLSARGEKTFKHYTGANFGLIKICPFYTEREARDAALLTGGQVIEIDYQYIMEAL
jgi:hypothetical protein